MRRIKLKKYPVKTPNGEYRVLVYCKYVTCRIYEQVCEIQIQRNGVLFNKFKTVYKYKVLEYDFKDLYRYNFIEFVKDAISTYEKENLKQTELNNNYQKHLETWARWDGVLFE